MIRGAPSGIEDPIHAPERGRLARWLGPLHVTGVFWYRIHLLAVRLLPRWLLPSVVLVFTVLFYCLLHRIRRAIAANLVPVIGPCGTAEKLRRVWRTLYTFAWCLTERYEYLAGRDAPEVEVEGLEFWTASVGRPEGLILLTAHIGNWEVASSLLMSHSERPVHLAREAELNPAAQRLIAGLIAGRAGPKLAVHFAGDPRLGLALSDALRRGEVVALQGDRPRAGGRTIPATMFGRPFDLPSGPFVLGRATGAALLPAFAWRTGRWQYRIRFGAPVRVASSGDRQADLAQAAAAIASGLAAAICEHPHQWFCFREVWPEDQVTTGRHRSRSPGP